MKRKIKKINIINHQYTIYEINYGGTQRGVSVVVKNIAARNNTQNYRLGRAYDPHDLDVNWYLHNVDNFYIELGTAVAKHLEANQQNWNQNLLWPNAIHAKIHRNGYHAIREDRY